MTRPVFRLMTFQPAARRCRLRAIVCAALTLWVAFDSQVLLLAAPGNLSSTSQNPSPSQEDDDDDYVLDLTGQAALGRGLRRNAQPPLPRQRQQIAGTKTCFTLSCHQCPLPTTPVSEYERRNGIGALLLC
jgi:hypothetical protein